MGIADVICMLPAKLPSHVRDKWIRHVLCVQRRELRESNLDDFVEFVKDEKLLVNDPLFSKLAIDQYCERSSKGSQQNLKHKRNKLTTYATIADSSKKQAFNCLWLARRKIF